MDRCFPCSGSKLKKKKNICFFLCRNYVLDKSEGIENLGDMKWQLLLCLLLAWGIVFLCLCKGVKSSGKVLMRATCKNSDSSLRNQHFMSVGLNCSVRLKKEW